MIMGGGEGGNVEGERVGERGGNVEGERVGEILRKRGRGIGRGKVEG